MGIIRREEKKMKVTYDEETQAIYIKVSDVPSSFGVIDHTEELVADTVLVDYLSSGEVYGIEVSGVEEIERSKEGSPLRATEPPPTDYPPGTNAGLP